ncbi:MAG: DUF4238 domain-containing protein [Rhodobacterales bacterium]
MSRNDRTAENHHTVPKNALLNNFAKKRKGKKSCYVYLYDKSEGKMVPNATSVDNVLVQRDFYSIKTVKGMWSIEQALATLEDKAAPVISQIVRTSSLAALSPENRVILATFVAAQYLRSPKIRDSQQILAESLASKAEIMAPNASNLDEIKNNAHEDVVKARSIKTIEDLVGDLGETLFGYRWLLHKAPKGHTFWISDCPVVMHNDEDFGPYGKLGLEVPSIQISIPLDSKHILSIWHPKIVKDMDDQKSDNIRRKGHLKNKLVLGANPDRVKIEILLKQIEKQLIYIDSVFERFDGDGFLQATADNIEHFNALQYHWALRFIVSEEANFELADRIFTDDPDADIKFTVD